MPSATSTVLKLKSTAAVAAHDKDLNQIAVSPNDALIATASQDKTVKVRGFDRRCRPVHRAHTNVSFL